MTYEDVNAIYALNSYVWKLLEANLDWSKDEYEGAMPIIPFGQQPEMMQAGKPFIVYGSAKHPVGHLYSVTKEAVSYTIYSTDATQANTICNLLSEVFDRSDVAAADVNDWLDVSDYGGITFGSIRTIMGEKATAADEEGGFYAALFMAECVYTLHDTETIQTTGFTP